MTDIANSGVARGPESWNYIYRFLGIYPCNRGDNRRNALAFAPLEHHRVRGHRLHHILVVYRLWAVPKLADWKEE
jgi:hypothetical protein